MQELALDPVAARAAVGVVTEQRVADRREVGADLVGAAGLEARLEVGVAPAAARSPRSGCGPRASPPPRPPSGSAGAIAADRGVDRPRARARAARRRAPGRRRLTSRALIWACERPHRPRRCGRRPSGRTCPCRAGGRCPGRSGPRRRRAVAELVDEGRPLVRGRRVDDEAGGLVDHRQRVVLVDDRGSASPSARRGRPQREQRDADDDRDVGEVEGRPGGEVDVVDHRRDPHPVGEVADGAADQQARREPDPRPARAARRSTAIITPRAISPSSRTETPPPPARPNATPSLRTREVRTGGPTAARPAEHELGRDDRLQQLVDRDDVAAQASARRQARSSRGAHPAIRPTTIAWTMNSRKVAMIGLRSKAIPPPLIGGRKRRKRFR